jgi:hypothetical protein
VKDICLSCFSPMPDGLNPISDSLASVHFVCSSHEIYSSRHKIAPVHSRKDDKISRLVLKPVERKAGIAKST